MVKVSYFTGMLSPHQSDAVNKLKISDAVLVYHGLGAGKTATSIAASEGQKTDVVVPASLRGNYEKELNKFTTDKDNRNVMSYQKFIKNGPSDKSRTLVLDEPQKIGRTTSQISQKVVNLSKLYDKRILLSGTPASNNPAELAPIIRVLNPDAKNIPLNPIDFNNRFLEERIIKPKFFQKLVGATEGVEYHPKNTIDIKNAIKNHVSYYESGKEDFPERIDEIRKVETSKEQKKYYDYVTESANPLVALKVRMNLPLSKKESTMLNAFMTAARQVSNSTTAYGGKEKLSPKLKSVVDDFENDLNKNPNHKGLIYSNYIDSGIGPIADEFEKRNIPFVKFTGGLSDNKRKEIIDDYNSGKAKAILVSSAGAEGLDLKGTRTIQIVEPHWNKNRIEQVIGRGIRYKSHDGLPKNEQNVRVIKYETVLPKSFSQKLFNKNPSTSTDEYLEELSNKKQETLDRFLDIFKQEGTTKQSNLIMKGGNMDKIDFLNKLAAEVANEPKPGKPESKGDQPDAGKGDGKKSEKKPPFQLKTGKPDAGKSESKPGEEKKPFPPAGNERGAPPKAGIQQQGEEGPGGEKEIPGNEAAEGPSVPGTGSIDPKSIFDFFTQNPTPTDEQFHEFAESKGFDVQAAEAAVYVLAGKFVMFLRGGKSQGLDPNSVDPEQLEMGISVEAEHSADPATQKKIALDHLAEVPDYYTKLQQVEGQQNPEEAAETPEQEASEGHNQKPAATPIKMDQNRSRGQISVGDGGGSMQS